jgi:hypothetical protein
VAVFWLPAPVENRSGATRHASPTAIGKTALWCGSYYRRKLRRKQPAVGAGIGPNSNPDTAHSTTVQDEVGWVLGHHFFNQKLFSATINKVSLCATMRLPFKAIVYCWSENGMATIHLVPDLAEQIESLVGSDPAETQAFIENALRAHIARLHQSKIRRETEAFVAQHQELLAAYPEQYIAMHEGNVIDHDTDLRTLHLRVYQQVGHTPVLLKKVTDATATKELVFRSPRLQRRSE